MSNESDKHSLEGQRRSRSSQSETLGKLKSKEESARKGKSGNDMDYTYSKRSHTQSRSRNNSSSRNEQSRSRSSGREKEQGSEYKYRGRSDSRGHSPDSQTMRCKYAEMKGHRLSKCVLCQNMEEEALSKSRTTIQKIKRSKQDRKDNGQDVPRNYDIDKDMGTRRKERSDKFDDDDTSDADDFVDFEEGNEKCDDHSGKLTCTVRFMHMIPRLKSNQVLQFYFLCALHDNVS